MRECNRSALFSKRVYWTTIPFLAVAMIVTTAIAGLPGIYLLKRSVGPDKIDAALTSYVFIAIATIVAEGIFFALGIWIIWRLMRRIVSLTDEMQMMTRSVLHDISTPLAHIQHKIDLFGDPDADPAEIRESVTDSCTHILHVIRLSGEISRTYEGLDREGAEPTDFAEIVRTTCEIFEAAAADKGVKLVCTTPSSPAIITAHAYRLQRLIGNLLDNALKFTPAGGKIDVTLSASTYDLCLSVSDTGIGMTPEERAHIFERFYRADKSRHTPGFGLGLTLVHAIVAFYRGTISVTSAPARGTTFAITLPKAEATSARKDTH